MLGKPPLTTVFNYVALRYSNINVIFSVDFAGANKLQDDNLPTLASVTSVFATITTGTFGIGSKNPGSSSSCLALPDMHHAYLCVHVVRLSELRVQMVVAVIHPWF